MTLTDLREQLRATCDDKTQKAFARELGVSLSYLNAVVLGTKAPGRKILDAIGLQRQVAYMPKGAAK